jgi:WD40 repeat protein
MIALLALFAPAAQVTPVTVLGASPAQAVAWSPNGNVVGVIRDKNIELWDVASSTVQFTFTGAKYPLGGIAFSPDGSVLAAGGVRASDPGGRVPPMQGVVYRWNAVSGQEMGTFESEPANWPQGMGFEVRFSPDGGHLAYLYELDSAGCYRTQYYIDSWDLSNGGRQQRPDILTAQGQSTWVTTMAYSPDGRLLAGAMADGLCPSVEPFIRVWDAASLQVVASVPNVNALALHFSADGATLVGLAGEKGVFSLRQWETTGYTLTAETKLGRLSDFLLARFSPDGNQLLVADYNGNIRLFDVATGKQTGSFRLGKARVRNIAYSPDGKRIATAAEDGVKIWQLG